MNLEKIRLEQEGRIVTLKIANGKANTLSRQVIEELHQALDEVERRDNVKEVVITGEGDRFFSAGADINEIAEFVLAGYGGRKPMTREERMQAAYEFSKRGQNLVVRLRNFPKPVTALINGMCFGGGFEVALGCHRRIAASNVLMGLPEVTLGIMPGWGGTYFLAKVVAERISDQALQYIMPPPSREQMGIVAAFGIIGRAYSHIAKDALELGIADEVVDGAREAISPPPRQVAPGVAEIVDEFVERQQELEEEEALEEEANYFADLCVMPEAQEGIRAFLEKRTPNFEKR